MRTVKDLIEQLERFPPDAVCYAYEGEITGVVVTEAVVRTFANGGRGRAQLGYIPCNEGDDKEEDTVLQEPRS